MVFITSVTTIMHFDFSCFNIETYSRIHNYKRKLWNLYWMESCGVNLRIYNSSLILPRTCSTIWWWLLSVRRNTLWMGTVHLNVSFPLQLDDTAQYPRKLSSSYICVLTRYVDGLLISVFSNLETNYLNN